MEKKYDFIQLNQNALNYVKSSLENGKDISKKILYKISKHSVKIWAMFPKHDFMHSLYDFESGGIGKVDETEKFLVEIVSDYLKKSPNNLFIIEDSLAKKGDEFLEKTTVNYFTFNDNVYFFILGDEMDSKQVHKMLKIANRYPFISFLTKVNKMNKANFKSDNLKLEINEYILDNIVKNIEEIFIGAYDEESYLRIKFE